MIKELLRYLLMFVSLVLVQVLILNNIQLSGLINPFVYILFILLLPIEISPYLLLLLGFFTGITIDVFSSTPGIHASATVFAAFIRPKVLGLLSSREEYESGKAPRIYNYGFNWFFRYIVIMVLFHHSFLFFAEAFTLTGIFDTLLRILASTVFSILLIVIFQYLFFRK